jgi:hypothetical protein
VFSEVFDLKPTGGRRIRGESKRRDFRLYHPKDGRGRLGDAPKRNKVHKRDTQTLRSWLIDSSISGSLLLLPKIVLVIVLVLESLLNLSGKDDTEWPIDSLPCDSPGIRSHNFAARLELEHEHDNEHEHDEGDRRHDAIQIRIFGCQMR